MNVGDRRLASSLLWDPLEGDDALELDHEEELDHAGYMLLAVSNLVCGKHSSPAAEAPLASAENNRSSPGQHVCSSWVQRHRLGGVERFHPRWPTRRWTAASTPAPRCPLESAPGTAAPRPDPPQPPAAQAWRPAKHVASHNLEIIAHKKAGERPWLWSGVTVLQADSIHEKCSDHCSLPATSSALPGGPLGRMPAAGGSQRTGDFEHSMLSYVMIVRTRANACCARESLGTPPQHMPPAAAAPPAALAAREPEQGSAADTLQRAAAAGC